MNMSERSEVNSQASKISHRPRTYDSWTWHDRMCENGPDMDFLLDSSNSAGGVLKKDYMSLLIMDKLHISFHFCLNLWNNVIQ